jgi:hypothetical protein
MFQIVAADLTHSYKYMAIRHSAVLLKSLLPMKHFDFMLFFHGWCACKWNLIVTDIETYFNRGFAGHFLCPPEEFIYKHFPFDPQWQLLAKPITKAEWLKK